MKRTAIVSLVSVLLLSASVQPALAGNARFPTLQRYYTGGDVQRFGQYFGAAERPTYDFNGDGVGDLLLMVADTFNILHGTPAGGFTAPVRTNVCMPTYSSYFHYFPYVVLDFNADGLDDIIFPNDRVDYYFILWSNNGTDSFEMSEKFIYDLAMYYMLCPSLWIYPGLAFDYDSDGDDDLYAYPVIDDWCSSSSDCAVHILENTGSNFDNRSSVVGNCEEIGWLCRHAVLTGDFNGDGHPDIWELWNYGSSWSILLSGDDWQYSVYEELFGGYFAIPRIGNFNGDQYDDMAKSMEMGCGNLYLGYWGSEGFISQKYNWSAMDKFPFCTGDFDDDGLDDIALQYCEGSTGGYFTVHMHYSEGDTFLARCDTMLLHAASGYYNMQLYSSDFNSDGRDDLLYFVADDTIGVMLQQGPTATFLQRFAARLDGPWSARLEWEVSGPADCESFSVSRASAGGPYETIASVAADPSRDDYSYTDIDISALSGKDVIYRLEAVYRDGSTSFLAEQELKVPRAELALHQNYPNPFNPGTVLSFTLPERAAVTLEIYDVSGRLVRRLLGSETMDAGLREVAWDGAGESGRTVSSGVYYCRLTAGRKTVTRKLVMMR